MGRSDRLYASPSNLHRRQTLRLWKGDIRHIEVDWNAVESERASTVTASSWETDDSETVCIANPSISAGVAEVRAEGCLAGSANLKNKATFADGSVAVAWWEVSVSDLS